MRTQLERLIEYMRCHQEITQLEAISELGIMRLASRISEAKQRGYQITDRFKTVKNRYGESIQVKAYSLLDEDESNEY